MTLQVPSDSPALDESEAHFRSIYAREKRRGTRGARQP